MKQVPALFLPGSKLQCHLNEATEKRQSPRTSPQKSAVAVLLSRPWRLHIQWQESQHQNLKEQDLQPQGLNEEGEHNESIQKEKEDARSYQEKILIC